MQKNIYYSNIIVYGTLEDGFYSYFFEYDGNYVNIERYNEIT